MNEYLSYKVYYNEIDYVELLLNNFDFALQFGIGKEKFGLTDFSYQMSLRLDDSQNPDNAMLADQFIFNLSSKIKDAEDIYKIEIELNRPSYNINRHYVFYNGDFANFNLFHNDTRTDSNIFITFVVTSMDQNYIKNGND